MESVCNIRMVAYRYHQYLSMAALLMWNEYHWSIKVLGVLCFDIEKEIRNIREEVFLSNQMVLGRMHLNYGAESSA
jgi:hypothetical protein